MDEIITQLKAFGIDFDKSRGAFAEKEEYLSAVCNFFNSKDFMRLGQSVNRQQWQAAAMQARKISDKANDLGIFAIERQMKGIRMNINAKNKEEVLGLLANVIQKRVKILSYFQNIKRDEK